MQFKIPQFLDIEDTIFGPFTFKEFVYLAGGGGMCFVLYKLLGFWLGLIPMLIVAGFSLALTFYKPNGKPFINLLQAGFSYLFDSKLYIWKRRKAKPKNVDKKDSEIVVQHTENKLTGDKLKNLAWSLDVLDMKNEKTQN